MAVKVKVMMLAVVVLKVASETSPELLLDVWGGRHCLGLIGFDDGSHLVESLESWGVRDR